MWINWVAVSILLHNSAMYLNWIWPVHELTQGSHSSRIYLHFSSYPACTLLVQIYWAPDFAEFMLGRCSYLCIAIAYSNSTFCGAWTFCEFPRQLSTVPGRLSIRQMAKWGVAISTCKPDAQDRIWDSSVWQNYFSVNQLPVTIGVNKLTHRLANCVEA